MFFFNLELLILEIFLILLCYLLLINSSNFARLFIALATLFGLFFILFLSNLAIFAIVLLSVEIHVIYFIMCILLIFNSGDNIIIDSLFSSNQLLLSRFIILCLFVIFCGVASLSNSIVVLGNCDIYSILLLSTNYINLGSISANQAVSVLTVLAEVYLLFNSFEFIIINFIMLFAIFLYYLINRVLQHNNIYRYARRLMHISNIIKFEGNFMRMPSQTVQLSRCAVLFNRGCSNNNNL